MGRTSWIAAAGALVLAAGCSGGSAGPAEPAPFTDGLFLSYAAAGPQDPVHYEFKKAGEGFTLAGPDGDVALDKNGMTKDGVLAPATKLSMGGRTPAPLWLPPSRRAAGKTAWEMTVVVTGTLGGESEEQVPVKVTGEEAVDGRPALLAHYKSEGLAMAFQFQMRVLYDKATGYLLKYEYLPFTGSGSGWILASTNAW